jgi:SAM-dependent methyltransferase
MLITTSINKNVENWDKSYKTGEWDYLFSPEELGHYLIMLGYIVYLCRPRRVLDAGCGAGRLLELLLPYQIDKYIGFDISTEAIERCHRLIGERSNIELQVADFDSFSAAEEFDVIVFNESIYYSSDPRGTLEKAAGWLAPGGALLLSIYRNSSHSDHETYWQLTSHLFTTSQATAVSNRQGLTWDVRMLRRK